MQDVHLLHAERPLMVWSVDTYLKHAHDLKGRVQTAVDYLTSKWLAGKYIYPDAFHRTQKCVSRSGVRRPRHDLDKDGRCIFCDFLPIQQTVRENFPNM